MGDSSGSSKRNVATAGRPSDVSAVTLGGHAGELHFLAQGQRPALASENAVKGEIEIAPPRRDFERALVEAADSRRGNRRREHSCMPRNGLANGQLTKREVGRMGMLGALTMTTVFSPTDGPSGAWT